MSSTDGTSGRAGSDVGRVAMSEPEASGPRDKKRAESKYTQKLKSRHAACQVKDCVNEVPTKAYHQRYKICLEHASAPLLLLDGRHMRFCQHHGRFHPVGEFDGPYRSCRASLERHRHSQARRLKKQSAARQASTSSDDEVNYGAGAASGGATRRPRTRGGGDTSGGASSGATLTTEGRRWDGLVQQPPAQKNQQQPAVPAPADSGADAAMLMDVLPGEDIPLAAPPPPPPLRDVPVPLPPVPMDVNDLDATDLLSLDILLEEEDIRDFGDWMLGQLDEPSGGAVREGDGDAAEAAVMSVPRTAAELGLPPVPALPSVPAAPLQLPSLDALLASASTVQRPQAAMRLAAHGSEPSAEAAVAAMAAASAILPNVRSTLDKACAGLSIDLGASTITSAAAATASLFHPSGPSSDGSLVVRASLKLFNTHPDALPPSVRDALQAMVVSSSTYLLANARPGCAQITFEAILSAKEAEKLRAQGAAGLIDAAMAAGPALLPPELVAAPQVRMVAQIGTQVAVIGDTGAEACFQLGDGGTGDLRAVIPLAVTPATAGQSQPFTALGKGISGPEDLLVCRRGEAVPDLGVIAAGTVVDAPGAASTGSYSPSSYTARGLEAGEYVQFSLMSLKPGLHSVEVQRGSLLSSSVPFLVLDDAAAAAELRQLEVDASGVEDVAAFVTAVGVVLDHLRLRQEAPDSPNASPAAAARVAPLAARAIAVAAARRWPSLLRLLAPATSPTQVDAGLAPSGLTLLHLIAGSGCAAVAEALVDVWGDQPWVCLSRCPDRITPLHVAAALDDGGAMASALTRLVGPDPWFTARSADGLTPAELAVAAGNTAVAVLLGCFGPKSGKASVSADAAKWMERRKFADDGAEEAWRKLSRAVEEARWGWGWGAQAVACMAILGAVCGSGRREGPALSYIAMALLMVAFAVPTMALRLWAGAA